MCWVCCAHARRVNERISSAVREFSANLLIIADLEAEVYAVVLFFVAYS